MAHLALADVQSVDLVSDLTTLETVPPQEAPVIQPTLVEVHFESDQQVGQSASGPQFEPDQQVGQPANDPLPQCKYCPSRFLIQFRIAITSFIADLSRR